MYQVGNVNGAYEPQPPPQRPQELPKQKAPLPEQYVHMQSVLDTLRAKCSAVASNHVCNLFSYKYVFHAL